MTNNLQNEIIANLKSRKKTSREFLRSLSPTEKIAKLVDLQEHYYQMLEIREQNGGRKIPEKWRKWHTARYENKSELILGKIADGETVDAILSSYPHLSREQILDCQEKIESFDTN